MLITFLGNFNVDYTSETHHVKSLESLGHQVICLQEGQAPGEIVQAHAEGSDLLVVVHTHGWVTPGKPLHEVINDLKKLGIKTITYHLDLWFGLQREKDLHEDPFYMSLDYFFCTDKLMADWFTNNTSVKGYYIPAGVVADEVMYNSTRSNNPLNNIIFVGSKGYHPEWKWRPQLIDWLHENYKGQFSHYGNDGLKVVRGFELNRLYASSKIAVGDTLCIGYDYPYYFSDRLFESTGRGAFTIFPYIKGIEDYFVIEGDKKEIVTFKFGNFEDLETKIDYYLENEKEREEIRLRGYLRTMSNHTYTHRWAEIMEVVNGE